jgi:hypothetical protein
MILTVNPSKFYYEITEEDDCKAKVLEMLLLIPWKDVATESLRLVLSQHFGLDSFEVAKAINHFHFWLTSPSKSLPHSSPLISGTREYWQLLKGDNTGWQWLADVALLFSATLSSEASVERSFSKGKYLTGDRRYSSSIDLMDAELMLCK